MTREKNINEVSEGTHPQHVERAVRSAEHATGTLPRAVVRLERRAALDLVIGEVSHELVHAQMFLRCLFEGAGQPTLSPEDVEQGRRQIERLQHMLRHLRPLKLPPPGRDTVRILDVLRCAETEIADLLADKRLTMTWAVEGLMTLRTDRPVFALLARNMLAAVLCDPAADGPVAIHATLPGGREDGTITVEYRQRATAQPSAKDPFDPWAAMMSGDAAMELAMCRRVARSLGWEIASLTEAGRAGFRLTIPAAYFVLEPPR